MTMTVHFFTIPALASQPAQDEFNHFCSMRRVVAVDRQFVADGRDSYWALCATVAPGSGLLPDALKAPERRSGVGKEGVASSSVRIVWWCPSRAAALASLDDLSDHLWRQRLLRLKPSWHIGRSNRGLAYCGFRVRPGVVLASVRKLTRYREGLSRVNAAQSGGLASIAQAQRAHDGLLATLTGAQTLGFRQRLLKTPGSDNTGQFGYPCRQGCGSL